MKDLLEAVIGVVFMTSATKHGIDRGMAHAWHLTTSVVLQQEGSLMEAERPIDVGLGAGQLHDLNAALSVLRARLPSTRPGPVKIWANRLSLNWISEPGLITAAALRAFVCAAGLEPRKHGFV